MRNLNGDWDFVFTKSSGETEVETYGGIASATQTVSSDAANQLSEEVKTACKRIHYIMPYHPRGGSKKETCYKVKHTIAPYVESISLALAKIYINSQSEVYVSGRGRACAEGSGESLAIQAMEVLRYALENASWNSKYVVEVMDRMKNDFVIAYSDAETHACTRQGKAKAVLTSLASALDQELHKMFPLIHYGFACDGYYAKSEIDKANTHHHGTSASIGHGSAGTDVDSAAGVGDDLQYFLKKGDSDYLDIFGDRR